MKMFNGVFLDVLSRIPLTLASSSLQDRTVGVSQTWSPKTASVEAVNRAPLIFWQHIFFCIRLCLPRFCYAVISVSRCCSTNASLFPFFSVLLYLFVSPFFPPASHTMQQLHFKIPTAGGVTDRVNCCLRSTCLLEKLKPRHFMKWKKKKLCQMESTHNLAKLTSSCGPDTT